MRFLLALAAFGQTFVCAQPALRQQIKAIASGAQGTVAVACSLPGTALDCNLNPHAHPPMQSVFKLPLAITTLHHVEQGEFTLDQPIRFQATDRILPKTYSPLQDKYPAAQVDVPLRELLRLAVSLSDNAASDVLLRIVGGPAAVNVYFKAIGISGFHLEDGEAELHRNFAAQYRNWFEPAAAVQLLRLLNDHPPLSNEHTHLLFTWMKDSPTGIHRIRGNLPDGTVVLHKTGTSGTSGGLAPATNDVGLVTLPDGRRLAIAIFVTNSKADEATRESVMARIAKAAYDTALHARK